MIALDGVWLGLSGEDPDPQVVAAVAGVGLVRGEYVMRRLGGHVVDPAVAPLVSWYLAELAGRFEPRSVWYRLADFEEREVATLRGCRFDPATNENPLLGSRGVRRARRHADEARAELASVVEAARHHLGLGLLLPYVGAPEEVRWAVELARALGFANPIGTMVETPAAVARIDELLDLGVLDGCLIGLNDLTTLTLGVERSDPHHDKFDPAVWAGVERVVAACQRTATPVGVAGDLDERLVARARSAGVDHVVVHYHQLDALVGPPPSPWRDRDVVARLRDEMRALLAGSAR